MKIRNIVKLVIVWLILGLGLSMVQPVRGQGYTNFAPLFQYAIFYDGLLEFSDCATLTVNGQVHCNTNIYVGTVSGCTLTFNQFVTCSGTITNPAWAGYLQSSWTGSNFYNGTPSPGWMTGFPLINLPMTNSYNEIINLPTAAEAAGNPFTNTLSLERYYYKADLIILVTNTTLTNLINSTNLVTTNVITSVTLKNSMFDSSPVTYSFTNNLPNVIPAQNPNYLLFVNMTNTWLSFGAGNWLTTNHTFYDARQKQTNLVTQIDVGKFGAWIGTNTNCLAKWNPSVPFNGIIYVADMRTTNAMYMDCVRLTNGQTIPSVAASNIFMGGSSYSSNNAYIFSGLTVATINPLYIAGLYNCPSNSNIGSTNTTGTRPCSVVCDALTILSPAWQDAASFAEATSGSVPVASTSDTVNTAIIAGNVPSTGTGATQYSGGLQNLPRLLEDWAQSTLWLNTSLVNLYPSAQATAQFQLPSAYYNAPTRHFSYDLNFASLASLPPGTPTFQSYSVTIVLTNLSQTYNGTARPVLPITTPSGVPVSVTYDGSPAAPTNAGSYSVVAIVNDLYDQGITTNTLVINKATAGMNMTGLLKTYDGTPKTPYSIGTTPGGLTVDLTYNGSTNAPINAGTYTVVATVDNPNIQGSETNSLIIQQAAAGILFNNLSQTYDGTAKSVSMSTVPANLNTTLTYNGSTNPPTNAGIYLVVGTVNDTNYQASGNVLLTISQAVASVTFSNLSQVFDGTAKSVSVMTSPPGLMVDLTYNGLTGAPTNAGSYVVIGTVDDTNYQGSATNNLVIAPPAPAPVTLSGSTILTDGTFQLNFTNTPGASFTVLGSADPTAPLTNWTVLGSVIEVSPGQFQFTDTQATNVPQGFYIIRSP